MNFGIRSFFFVVLFSLSGSFFAEARALKCDGIFQPTVKDIIEKVNEEYGQFLFQGKSFEEFSQNLSWRRKRKVRKLIQDLEIRSFPSEKALDRYVVELGIALFGQKEIVDRWLFKTEDRRLEDSTILLIKEQLLKEGLLRTWGDVYNPAQVGVIKKNLDRIWTLQNSRIGELLRLPFMLPALKNQEISKELMYKIIRDGFNAHAEEVRLALKHQNKIEAYNTFRKLYGPIFMGVVFITQILQAYDERERAQEQAVEQTIQNLREQRETIKTSAPLVKQEILNEAYKAAEAEFIQKWGEPPTLEEQAILKAKIEKALNMH